MDNNLIWTLTTVIFGILFLISEYLSMSKCRANGVIEFVVSGIPCLVDREMRVSFEEVARVINAEPARYDGESRPQHPRVVALR